MLIRGGFGSQDNPVERNKYDKKIAEMAPLIEEIFQEREKIETLLQKRGVTVDPIFTAFWVV